MFTGDRHTLSGAVSLLAGCTKPVILTGAGVSAESGVPTFRGQDGLWEGRRLEEVATPEAFRRDPAMVWNFYRQRIRGLAGVKPNPGHYALVRLEERHEWFRLITQNVDGLHTDAGSRDVIEIHGTIRQARCNGCDHRQDIAGVLDDPLPKCPECDSLLRPAVVWFGEMLPPAALAATEQAIAGCDLMMVVGTSGVVEPAASFALWARSHGAKVVEVNLERTPISEIADVSVFGKSGEILPELIEEGRP